MAVDGCQKWMSEFLSFGLGEEDSYFISFGFRYIEVTGQGEVIVHLERFFYCPKCGTNAPLGQRFYAVPNVFLSRHVRSQVCNVLGPSNRG